MSNASLPSTIQQTRDPPSFPSASGPTAVDCLASEYQQLLEFTPLTAGTKQPRAVWGGLIIQINAITKAACRCVYALPIYYYHTKQYYWIPISSIASLRPTNNFNSSTKNQTLLPLSYQRSPIPPVRHLPPTPSLSKEQALETCPYPHNHAYITVQMNENHIISHLTSHVLAHHYHHHHTNAVTYSPRNVIGSGKFPLTIQLL